MLTRYVSEMFLLKIIILKRNNISKSELMIMAGLGSTCYMRGALVFQSLHQSCEVGAMITPILQMRKRRHREIKILTRTAQWVSVMAGLRTQAVWLEFVSLTTIQPYSLEVGCREGELSFSMCHSISTLCAWHITLVSFLPSLALSAPDLLRYEVEMPVTRELTRWHPIGAIPASSP